MVLIRVEGTIKVEEDGTWGFQTGLFTDEIMFKGTIGEVLAHGSHLFGKTPGDHHFIITLETHPARSSTPKVKNDG